LDKDEMSDTSFLDWPFFEPRHRELAAALEAWCAAHLPVSHDDVDAACKGLVAALGGGGWLTHSGAGEGERLDVRALCLIRETLARHDGLADFAFAMQGLGMGRSACSAHRHSGNGWRRRARGRRFPALR
jgi:acyl-CoA dehydrogenase